MPHHPHQRWTLADFQAFLSHSDPIIRGWATDRLEKLYPHHAVESLAGLLTDSDSHLQISAARAISESGDTRFEPALLAV